MGNTTSTKIAAVSALESIQKDAHERLLRVELDLIEVKKALIFREALTSAKVKELLEKRSKLHKHAKILKSNFNMASNGLMQIHQKVTSDLCEQVEKTTDAWLNGSSSQKITDEEVAAFIASLK
jgi:hypothetical protein